MDIRSFFDGLWAQIPETVRNDLDFPDLPELSVPNFDIVFSLEYLALFAAGFVLLGLLGRVFLGKRSSLNHALSSSIGILLIYAVTACVYILKPLSLDDLLSPLPFVAFRGEYMRIFPLGGAHFSVICYEVLGMLILAFLMNLFDSILPDGEGILRWYMLRFLSVILVMGSHILVRWLFSTYLPDALALYAPAIVLCVLVAFLLMGIINFLLGLVLTATNPILGAIYTFFFSTLVGKQLSKAVFTTAILTAVVFLLEHLGIGMLLIAQTALLAYIPAVLLILVLWYLIGHIL